MMKLTPSIAEPVRSPRLHGHPGGLSHCHGDERKASAVEGFSGCCDGGPPCGPQRE